MKSWEISRRAVLRGSGAAIGLPVLEAMLPGLKRVHAATPRRLVIFTFSGGTPDTRFAMTGAGAPGTEEAVPGSFWPRAPGQSFETTTLLQPFEDLGLKPDMLLVN